MRTLTFSTQQVEGMIVRSHSLDERNAAAIASRLRYLQRLDFPRRTERTRGLRTTYDLSDALRIALVFRMLEWNQSPVRAMRTVAMNWSTLAQLMVVGWRALRLASSSPGRASDIRVVAVVAPAALQEAVAAGGDDVGQGFEAVQVMAPSDLLLWAEGDPLDGDDPQFLLLDPARIVRSFVEGCGEVCGYYDFETDAAFVRLGEEAFGSTDQAGWRVGARV